MWAQPQLEVSKLIIIKFIVSSSYDESEMKVHD
jgi:hypothetical protein